MIKKHSFSLLPFVRAVKGSDGKLLAIYLRITVDGETTEISTMRDRSGQMERDQRQSQWQYRRCQDCGRKRDNIAHLPVYQE